MAEQVTGTVVVDGLVFQVVEKGYKDGQAEGTFKYNRPDSPEMFKAWVAATSAENLSEIFKRWEYAHDLKERAKMREGSATTNAVVRFKKYGDVDLLTGEYGSKLGEKAATGDIYWAGEPLPLANRIAFVNATVAAAAAQMADPSNKVRYAREQMIAQKLAKDVNGSLRPA